jgi:hypothetical protein
MAAVEKIKESSSPQIFSGTATGRSKRKAFVRYHTKQGVSEARLCLASEMTMRLGGRAKQTRSVCEITEEKQKKIFKEEIK